MICNDMNMACSWSAAGEHCWDGLWKLAGNLLKESILNMARGISALATLVYSMLVS